MYRLLCRLDQAWLLLVVMLFMAMPRSAFHHCEEGTLSFSSHQGSPVVHVDVHCPMCEAPLPIFDGVPELLIQGDMVCLGTAPAVPGPAAIPALNAAPRLRGPPLTA